jgi:trimeric autotransporter adhesin
VLGDFGDVNSGGYGALRPDVTGQPVQLSQRTVDRFFNTSAFMLPKPDSFGNAGRNSIIGPAIFTLDAALAKTFQLREGHNLQFRAQASNLLNTPEFTQVDTNLRSLSYGQITGVGNMRVVQLGLRYWF